MELAAEAAELKSDVAESNHDFLVKVAFVISPNSVKVTAHSNWSKRFAISGRRSLNPYWAKGQVFGAAFALDHQHSRFLHLYHLLVYFLSIRERECIKPPDRELSRPVWGGRGKYPSPKLLGSPN